MFVRAFLTHTFEVLISIKKDVANMLMVKLL